MTPRRLLPDFGALAAGEVLARVAGLGAIVLLARRLDADGFGIVALGTTLVLWFAILGDAGTEHLTTRDVAREPARFRAIASPVLGLRLGLSLLAAALFAGGALVVSPGAQGGDALALYALVLPALALNLRFMALGVGAANAIAVGNIVSQGLFVAGVLVLVQEPSDVTIVPLVQLASEGLYAGVVAVVVGRRAGIPVPRIDLGAWRTILRGSLPLLANNAARTALYSFDVVLIAAVLGAAKTATYSVAYKPVLFISGVTALFASAFLATYSGAAAAPGREGLVRRAVRGSLAVTVPLAAGIALTAPWLIELMVGDRYDGAAAVLAILAWSLPLLAVTVPYAAAMLVAERQRRLMRHNLTVAAANVAANVALVPLLGLNAAAAVTVISFALLLWLIHRSCVEAAIAPPLGVALRPGVLEKPLPG